VAGQSVSVLAGQRIGTGNNETKNPTCKPDVRATRFIPSLGVRATHKDIVDDKSGDLATQTMTGV
jgi:hypothetical protein